MSCGIRPRWWRQRQAVAWCWARMPLFAVELERTGGGRLCSGGGAGEGGLSAAGMFDQIVGVGREWVAAAWSLAGSQTGEPCSYGGSGESAGVCGVLLPGGETRVTVGGHGVRWSSCGTHEAEKRGDAFSQVSRVVGGLVAGQRLGRETMRRMSTA